jgi:hypothetical protein
MIRHNDLKDEVRMFFEVSVLCQSQNANQAEKVARNIEAQTLLSGVSTSPRTLLSGC